LSGLKRARRRLASNSRNVSPVRHPRSRNRRLRRRRPRLRGPNNRLRQRRPRQHLRNPKPRLRRHRPRLQGPNNQVRQRALLRRPQRRLPAAEPRLRHHLRSGRRQTIWRQALLPRRAAGRPRCPRKAELRSCVTRRQR
jgi:hypothetical protein